MEKLELILSIVAILIALGGIIYTLTTRRELDKQQIQLNAIELKSKEKEDEDKLKAAFDLSVVGFGSGKYKVILTNKGDANANNIRFEDLSGDSEFYVRIDKTFPFEVLMPGKSITINAWATEGVGSIYTAKITWSDDYKEDRTVKLSAPIG